MNNTPRWPLTRPAVHDVWACVVWDAGPHDAQAALDLLQAALWSFEANLSPGASEEHVFLHTLFESIAEADEDMPAPTVRTIETATELLINYRPKGSAHSRTLREAVDLITETLERVYKTPSQET